MAKTTTPKNKGVDPAKVPQVTNNELHEAFGHIQDNILRAIADLRKETFDARGAVVSHLNTINERVTNLYLAQEPKEVAPDPWIPKVGDKVKFKVPWEGSEEYGVGTIDGRDIVPNHVGVTWESGSKSGENVREIRPLTPAEIAKHLAEEEAKKPLIFGMRVKWQNNDYRVICDAVDERGYVRIIRDGYSASPQPIRRSELTIIPEPK
jgi:hypothetical protein